MEEKESTMELTQDNVAETSSQESETTPEEPVSALYDLPDGRKVDAETLQKEWKENFLPEFTRKSQRLAEYEKAKTTTSEPETPKWKDPDYVPQTYAEIVELAAQEMERRQTEKAETERARLEAIQNEVNTTISELKKIDPKLDENALFTHANKYGFNDLKAAYGNYRDMTQAIVKTEQRTVKNLQKRDADPVSSAAGGGMAGEDGYDPKEMSQFGSALEYLQRLKGSK